MDKAYVHRLAHRGRQYHLFPESSGGTGIADPSGGLINAIRNGFRVRKAGNKAKEWAEEQMSGRQADDKQRTAEYTGEAECGWEQRDETQGHGKKENAARDETQKKNGIL